MSVVRFGPDSSTQSNFGQTITLPGGRIPDIEFTRGLHLVSTAVLNMEHRTAWDVCQEMRATIVPSPHADSVHVDIILTMGRMIETIKYTVFDDRFELEEASNALVAREDELYEYYVTRVAGDLFMVLDNMCIPQQDGSKPYPPGLRKRFEDLEARGEKVFPFGTRISVMQPTSRWANYYTDHRKRAHMYELQSEVGEHVEEEYANDVRKMRRWMREESELPGAEHDEVVDEPLTSNAGTTVVGAPYLY